MPKYVNTKNPELMEDLLEPAIRAFGFRCVYDGSKREDFENGGTPSFFWRVYRWFIDGRPVNTWIKFTYDLRTGRSDFAISSKDLAEYHKNMDRLKSLQKENVEKQFNHIKEMINGKA